MSLSVLSFLDFGPPKRTVQPLGFPLESPTEKEYPRKKAHPKILGWLQGTLELPALGKKARSGKGYGTGALQARLFHNNFTVPCWIIPTILLNHRSFQKPAIFPGVSGGFLERFGSLERMEMEGNYLQNIAVWTWLPEQVQKIIALFHVHRLRTMSPGSPGKICHGPWALVIKIPMVASTRSPSSALLPPFLGEGSPTNID